MSLYEGLSLVLSTFGTIFTVVLGFRQLRQAAPAQAGPAIPASYSAPPVHRPGPEYGPLPGAGAAPSTYGTPPPPVRGMEYGRAPASPAPAMHPTSGAPPTYGAPPTSGAPTYGAPTSGAPQAYGTPPTSGAPQPYGARPGYAPPAYRPPGTVRGLPATRVRPRSVRTASILLFITAALQPVVLLTYYGVEYAINADTAATDFGTSGATDVIGFGVIAVLCGVLGILVARGNRVAVWFVWVFGVLGVPFALLSIVGTVLTLLEPSEDRDPVGLLLVVVAYLIVVSLALAASAALLINSKARDFFFKKVA
jgi:hypothetical protein